MLVRLVSNSQPQVIRLPWLPKVLGLQAGATAPHYSALLLTLLMLHGLCLHLHPPVSAPVGQLVSVASERSYCLELCSL